MSITNNITRAVHLAGELLNSNKVITVQIVQELDNCTKVDVSVQGHLFNALELPWKENQRNISRIPRGVYVWQKITRSSNGQPAVWLRDVHNRSEILIHEGTKPHHSKGCILVPNYKQLHELLDKRGIIILL